MVFAVNVFWLLQLFGLFNHFLPLIWIIHANFHALSIGQPAAAPPASSLSRLDQWICPNVGASYFDTSPCDPNAPFSCPAKFKCRLATKRIVGLAPGTQMGPAPEVRFLCCESREMAIGDWLLDSGLSPVIFPQLPNATLWQVMLRDPESGRQARVDENGADISLLSGGDPGYGNFSQLEAIVFRQAEVPKASGFLHILEAIEQLAPLSAIRLHYDYPSFGSEQLDLHSHNQRFPRGFSQAMTSGFVPATDFYRIQNVIMVFKSDLPLSNRSTDIDRWMAWSEGKFPKLMWENGSGMNGLLGRPLVGFIFNLTTRGSIFPINLDNNGQNNANNGNQTEMAPSERNNETPKLAAQNDQPAAAGTGLVGQLAYEPGLQPEWTMQTTNQPNENSSANVGFEDNYGNGSLKVTFIPNPLILLIFCGIMQFVVFFGLVRNL